MRRWLASFRAWAKAQRWGYIAWYSRNVDPQTVRAAKVAFRAGFRANRPGQLSVMDTATRKTTRHEGDVTPVLEAQFGAGSELVGRVVMGIDFGWDGGSREATLRMREDGAWVVESVRKVD